jgi:HEAT repeat protein
MKTRIAFALLALIIAVTPLVAQSRAERAVEREQELYEDATDSLDDQEWRSAADKFRRVVNLKMSHADAAMYWLAYAQNKMGQRPEALATLVELQNTFPKSKWASDGKALEVEIRQSSGQRVEPDDISDEDVKLMAVNGLMHTDPARAVPLLEKIIAGNQPKKVKDKALFVLSQSGSPRGLEVLGRVARNGGEPELQAKALRYLGISGGEDSRRVLQEVYASTSDRSVKKSILKAYMISSDNGRLLALAKTEPDEELRSDAVRQLGLMGARNELSVLYAAEPSIEVKESIIKAMFLGGAAQKLADIARTETVPELKIAAIKNLGLMGNTTGPLLLQLYETNSTADVRKAVVHGLFLQGNAKGLITLAKKEKDPAVKKSIIQKLSIMGSEEATEYLMELLND